MSNLAKSEQRCAQLLLVLLLTIIVLVPFQGFVTTWLSSVVGGELLLWRAWKEGLLVLAVLTGLWLVYRQPTLARQLIQRPVNKVILLFAGWQLLIALLLARDFDAGLLGLTIQLRLFIIFLLAQVAVFFWPLSRQTLRRLVLVPAAIVVGFGLLQLTVLPPNFLSHFGYIKDVTIPPFFTIDEQLDQLRIASTLRGPNTLGAYLILPILLLVSSCTWWLKRLLARQNLTLRQMLRASLHGLFLLASLVVLYGSHSRSAWLGLALALAVWLLLSLPKNWRRYLVAAGVVAVLIGGVGLYQYRQTTFVQNVILHDNSETGGAVSSNQGHLEAAVAGVRDVQTDPLLGCAPGCAGPASVHHQDGAKISENYYLQTAQESGVIGLLLLLTIFGLVIWQLSRALPDRLAQVWLASFVGILLINLLLHTWADDTLAYLWWGIAGCILWTRGTTNQPKRKPFSLT